MKQASFAFVHPLPIWWERKNALLGILQNVERECSDALAGIAREAGSLRTSLEVEDDLRQAVGYNEYLTRIRAAKDRLRLFNSYGKCQDVDCGQEIDLDYLRQLPLRPLCRSCQRRADNTRE